ncbi:acyl-CoA thioesterase [Pseudomonas sp. PhalM4]
MITFRGVVYPAQTDAMGHMNVQHYIASFDQAFWHFVDHLGYDAEWRTSRQEGWADVHYEIDFRSELHVGAVFYVESTLKKVGRSSMVTHHALFDNKKQLCAEIAMTSVYFDLEARKAIEIPELIRASASSLIEAPTA